MDADGSVYAGTLGPRDAGKTAGSRAIRAEGTNQTLGASVVFDGELAGAGENERVQGRVQINRRDQFPIQATPLKP